MLAYRIKFKNRQNQSVGLKVMIIPLAGGD